MAWALRSSGAGHFRWMCWGREDRQDYEVSFILHLILYTCSLCVDDGGCSFHHHATLCGNMTNKWRLNSKAPEKHWICWCVDVSSRTPTVTCQSTSNVNICMQWNISNSEVVDVEPVCTWVQLLHTMQSLSIIAKATFRWKRPPTALHQSHVCCACVSIVRLRSQVWSTTNNLSDM